MKTLCFILIVMLLLGCVTDAFFDTDWFHGIDVMTIVRNLAAVKSPSFELRSDLMLEYPGFPDYPPVRSILTDVNSEDVNGDGVPDGALSVFNIGAMLENLWYNISSFFEYIGNVLKTTLEYVKIFFRNFGIRVYSAFDYCRQIFVFIRDIFRVLTEFKYWYPEEVVS